MYKLKNYMEILVDQMYDEATQDMDICKCPRCVLDVKAIALNTLKPRYIVADENYLYVKISMMQQQYKADIISAITKGTMIVSENPRHD